MVVQTDSRLADLADLLAGKAPMPKTMVVMAHPDDEVVGLGGHLPRFCAATFVHVTDGAPRDGSDATANGFRGCYEYGVARRRELESALQLAGVDPSQLLEIACPDQQASLWLVQLSQKLAELMQQHRPDLVITQPYEGGHPDHDATAFAVHAALQLLTRAGERAPRLLETSSYHIGPEGLQPFCFLPANTASDADQGLVTCLDDNQRELKRRMFAQFKTQQGTLQYFPISVECLRPAPSYRFTAPPHEGRLFYEMYNWGMTGHRFTTLAAEAITTLGLEEVF